MRIHFIGIGGIGVSALARYFLEKGHQVSGSDLVSSEITDSLKEKGAKLFIGKHTAKNVPRDTDMVIYSPAISKNNPELKQAKKLKILSYPQALGELTKSHFTIAVSGTHGKSTTTAMVGLILAKAGFNPTVIVGTKVKEFGSSNCRVGKPIRQNNSEIQYLVIEADEYSASFLNYWPKIIVLTSLEPDHLDYYKNFKNYISAFKKFVSHLPKDGTLVTNKDDGNIRKINSKAKSQKQKLQFKIQNYSLKQSEAKKIKKILKIPGEHNVSNALAALSVARVLKIPDKISFKALSEYNGSWRRFEEKQIKINNKSIMIVSDYAHHPTEIKVTLRAARERYQRKKIWCIFQPHQRQRTYYLFNDFVKVFREALWPKEGQPLVDKLIITDIYDVTGREEKKITKKVSSKKLVTAINKSRQKMTPAKYISNFREIEDYLKKNLKGGEVVIIMGAGDIYKLTTRLTSHKVL